jgi:predicted small secreted protein
MPAIELEACTIPGASGAGLISWSVPMKALSLLFAACLFLSACETIKGVGRDIENAGEAIDDAVDD